MSNSEGKDILVLQLVVLFKVKKKKRRKKIWVRELFRKREKGTFNNLIQKIKLADWESFLR